MVDEDQLVADVELDFFDRLGLVDLHLRGDLGLAQSEVLVRWLRDLDREPSPLGQLLRGCE